jgi:hypothetical protein
VRPVNLIPVEERRGASRAPAGSTGNGVYVMLGVLGVALFGTVLVVLQGNKVNHQKSQLAALTAEAAKSKKTVDGSAPDLAFEQAAQARFDLVHQTAADRFNFERRLRQLTRAVPNTVKLGKLDASLSGDGGAAASGGAGASAGAAASAGGDPSFDLSFCVVEGNPWQQAAEMITRMRNLDGVKKVSIDQGNRPQKSSSDTAPAAGGGESGGPCSAEDFNGGLKIVFKGKASDAAPAASAGAPAQTATQQAQGGAATSAATNSAAGADGSSGGGTP